MKKLFGTLMVLALMLVFLPATASAHTEDDPLVVDLIAGQHTDAGDVLVWNDANYLYVKYTAEPGWCITETHLAVAETLAGIPQTKTGNPIPGRFENSGDYKKCETEVLYVYDLAAHGWDVCDQSLTIAAHAVVKTGDKKHERTETAWGNGEQFEGKNWAMYFGYTVQCEFKEKWPDGGTTTVGFEDLPLDQGNDWDYNDFVVDIDIEATFWGTSTVRNLTRIDFAVRPAARVAGYTHVLHLDTDAFACSGNYELSGPGISDSGSYDGSTGIDVVLVPNTGSWVYPDDVVSLSISFEGDCEFSFPVWDQEVYHGENLFFDPYIYVNQTGEAIHTGDVRMLTVPTDWQWPGEFQSIWLEYQGVSEPTTPTGGPVFTPLWWETPPPTP